MPASSPVAPDTKLERYGELTVRVALNVQPGQRLLIIGPLMNGGVSLEAAPLVRHIAASAYRAGAELVEAIWGDEALQLARFTNAPRTASATSPRGCPKRSPSTPRPATPSSRSTRTIRICCSTSPPISPARFSRRRRAA